MKRDFLKAMGLTDEQIDSVLNNHSAALGAEIAKTNAAKEQVTALQADISTRDKDLTELRKAADGNKDLQDKYSALEKQYKDAGAANQAAMQAALMRAALNVSLSPVAQDVPIVSGLIDATKIELDDNGMIKAGLKEQIEQLQKDKPFLFKATEGGTGGKPSGSQPNDSNTKPPAPNDRAAWDTKLAEARKQPNSLHSVIKIKNEAAQAGHILH